MPLPNVLRRPRWRFDSFTGLTSITLAFPTYCAQQDNPFPPTSTAYLQFYWGSLVFALNEFVCWKLSHLGSEHVTQLVLYKACFLLPSSLSTPVFPPILPTRLLNLSAPSAKSIR